MIKVNFKVIYLFFLFIYTHISFCESIYVFSIPKCGTHLVAKGIELITKKKLAGEIYQKDIKQNYLPKIKNTNEFFRSHLYYIQQIHKQIINSNFKVFFIYRDPRDQIISRAFWIQKRLPPHICKDKDLCKSIHKLIDYLINDINQYYRNYLPWKNAKEVCTLKFENLVGPIGGGSIDLQKTEVTKMCQYLNVLSEENVNYCMSNLFGGTYTFRKGQIGSWKKYFTQAQKNKFKQVAGKLLIELGYEKNQNW